MSLKRMAQLTQPLKRAPPLGSKVTGILIALPFRYSLLGDNSCRSLSRINFYYMLTVVCLWNKDSKEYRIAFIIAAFPDDDRTLLMYPIILTLPNSSSIPSLPPSPPSCGFHCSPN